jgi:membrane fusion protein (multidrug efflux system)
VIAVHGEDDDRVKKGDLLVELDPRDYQVAVEQAKARVKLARAQLASAKQDYAVALAKVREAEAANFKAQRDARRYSILLAQQVAPLEQYDQYVAIARVDAAKVDSAQQAAGSAGKAIAAREAHAQAAQAALDQALLNLSYAKIYAPANGIIGKRSVQLGSHIEPGQTLMFVTETDAVWVIANFKETQLARMHRGELVTIHVDTFARDHRGYVERMPGVSGDRVSLLPPENATGNYVKVVQRLPVRFLLEAGQDPDHQLHPGMSVEPTVWLQQSHRKQRSRPQYGRGRRTCAIVRGRSRSPSRWQRSWSCSTPVFRMYRCRTSLEARAPATTKRPGCSPATDGRNQLHYVADAGSLRFDSSEGNHRQPTRLASRA